MNIHCKYDELVDVGLLKPHPKNRNKHPEEQIERLAKILKYQGVRAPIVVSNRSGKIVKGHGTLQAIKANGWDKAPIVTQDFDDDDQEWLFVQSDNAIASWAELDLKGINADLKDLGPFDIDLIGLKNFAVDPSEKNLGDEEATPEVRQTDIQLGDLFMLGDHRLLCGDSTDAAQVERLMNGEKASVWLSDPPYGINHVEVSQEKGQSKGYKKIQNDDLKDDEFKEFIYKCITTSLPHMKKGFAFYMWHAMKMQGYTAAAAAAAAGILFHRQIIWVKERFVFGRGHYHWKHELCLMGWLQGSEPPFYGQKNQTTVWQINRENDKIHPTQKPVALLESSILNHTKPLEIIYEPFCGSGSTLIASEKNNRKCYGMELDPQYCQVIVDRWEKYTGKKAVKHG